MKLHVFNPEHDIALAFNRKHLTMPHASQELRMNLGWIPALWAADGDVVMVDDVNYAAKAAKKFGLKKADVLFLSKEEVKSIRFDEVQPWGWDLALRTQLLEAGVGERLLPSGETLAGHRELSSRRQTTDALRVLRDGLEDETCGESFYMTTTEMGGDIPGKRQRVVLKAPWSSSGRGVRYVHGDLDAGFAGWLRRVVKMQGGVMVEPYYNKVKDFGMEFYAHEDGTVSYEGLSLFHTSNSTYTGSILASEAKKRQMLSAYVPETLINAIIQRAEGYFSKLVRSYKYEGPFGIDMMIVAHENGRGFLLHPCVEINVRRTMGHVALALAPGEMAPPQLMEFVHDVNYILKIRDLENNYVQTL